MTDHERDVMKNLLFALSWHCHEGIGPRGCDEKFMADARALLVRDAAAKREAISATP